MRLDDPVLRFLPELRAASQATGVPVGLLAGVVRAESGGDPGLIVAGRGHGLTGVSDSVLSSLGIPAASWYDAAQNLLAGAFALATHRSSVGSWDGALTAYFGPACDSTGLCSPEYRYAVLAWQTYYDPAVQNPAGGMFPVLPPDWPPPQTTPHQGLPARPLPLPPGVSAPTPTPVPTQVATATAAPSTTVLPTATQVRTATAVPTETSLPTETAVPMATETPAPSPTPTLLPDPTAEPVP